MAARTSASATRALEWTRRHMTPSLQATTRTRTVLAHLCRTTPTARLSTFAAHLRQAHKPTLPEPVPSAVAGSTPKQPSTIFQKPAVPSTTSIDSIPIVQPPKQTPDRRIHFVSHHNRPRTRSKYSSDLANPKIPGATEYLNTSTHIYPNNGAPTDTQPRPRKRPTRFWDNYRPGFKPGDFICPQCGTHNFRPPEYTQAAFQQSTVVPSRRNGRASQEQQQQQKEQQDSHGEAHATSGRPLTRFQREIIPPQRKYPQGAAGHCFECGFKTSYTLPTPKLSPTSKGIAPFLMDHDRASSQTTTTAARRDDIETAPSSSSSSSSFTSYTSQQYRNDIRLTKARDYVCPECQTVNYNNRLHCVGCGVLAPWIYKQVEQGSSATNKRSKMSGNGSSSHGQGSRSSSQRGGAAGAATRPVTPK